jgi:hypothetical protein
MYANTNDIDCMSASHAARTTTVVVFLAAFAVMASWLGVYAVPNALAAAGLIGDWSTDGDARPVWMLRVFITVFGSFATIGMLFRWASRRQLRRIDAMADADD